MPREPATPPPQPPAPPRVPGRWRLSRIVPRALRERRAVITLEFAVILGPLIGVLLVCLQVPLIFIASETLQGAALMAGRQIMTGQVQQSGMTQQAFQQAVCNILPGLFACNAVMVDVESAGNYSQITTGAPSITYGKNGQPNNSWPFAPGGPDDVVIVRVMYNWPVIGGSLIPGIANQPGGNLLLVGTAVFKNEPYP